MGQIEHLRSAADSLAAPTNADLFMDWEWTRRFCDRCLEAVEVADLRQMVDLRDDLLQAWRDRPTQASQILALPAESI